MGLILAIVFGLALFLNLLKKCKNFYYRHMLDLNQLYSRYLNHMIILVLLIVVHFFSLSYLVVQTAELLPLDQYRSQYPYDVIWITEKDNKGYAKKLASTFKKLCDEQYIPAKYYTFIEDVPLNLGERTIRALVSQTGYTGEYGFEIYCKAEDTVDLWKALLKAGEPEGRVGLSLGNDRLSLW